MLLLLIAGSPAINRPVQCRGRRTSINMRTTRRRKTPAKTDAHAYPRPLLARPQWTNLNGVWDFCIDEEARCNHPSQVKWNRKIVVPFAPETPLSGIGQTHLFKACWYRRKISVEQIPANHRIVLHFGAVDYRARIWINDHLAADHEGGYLPFQIDITDLLDNGKADIIVCATDDPNDLCKPRGKQDWLLEPHSIWYARTTGIWQTVWMESVAATRITAIQWSSEVSTWSIAMQARFAGEPDGCRLAVRLRRGDRVLMEDVFGVFDGSVSRTLKLPDPGIDDARNALLWWPWAPNLIDVELELSDRDGRIIDRATSYTAMRSVGIAGRRFIMNGRPMMLRLVLDQGYWRESGLTAPSDDALRQDIELTKEMGFNGVRKHQKIEDPRYLYWADRLGLMVWEEMPSAYAFDDRTVARVSSQWAQAIQRDISHPCIVAWVPLNESWGVPDLPQSDAQRAFARSLYFLTRALDPSRPVSGNDGWEHLETDILTIHDYDGDAARIQRRYEHSAMNIDHLFKNECPGNKALLLDGTSSLDRPIMLTEFGGIAFSNDPSHTWGYRRAGTAGQFKQQLNELMNAIRALPLLSGFCYTQFTDTYQEANGLLYMDRRPKLPLRDIRRMISGE
jgi:beta-galactosidase/beta-glucuronidase